MILTELSNVFLSRLHRLFGLVEPDLRVIPMRKSKRPRKTIGYYRTMSQFQSHCDIVVNFDLISDNYLQVSDADEEVLKTIAYGYACAILEVVEYLPSRGVPLNVPDWKAVFKGDKAEFAKDFARLCVTYASQHEEFWERFMMAYAREHHRLFCATADN